MVIGALAAGVCLICLTAGIIRTKRDAIREWLDTSLAADIIITAGSPVGSGGQNEPMNESLRDELMKIAGVEEVLPTHQSYSILFREDTIALTTIIAERADAIERKRLPKHDHLKLYAAMMREKDAVIVSENFAALHQVRSGDFITLPSSKGEVKLHVIGTVVDYTWTLGTIIMNRSDYIEHWQDPSVTLFEVYVQPGADVKAVKS